MGRIATGRNANVRDMEDAVVFAKKGGTPVFGKLLDRLRNATHPFKGFLGELWTIWTRAAI